MHQLINSNLINLSKKNQNKMLIIKEAFRDSSNYEDKNQWEVQILLKTIA